MVNWLWSSLINAEKTFGCRCTGLQIIYNVFYVFSYSYLFSLIFTIYLFIYLVLLWYILNVCNVYIESLNVIFFICVYRFLNVIFFMRVNRPIVL